MNKYYNICALKFKHYLHKTINKQKILHKYLIRVTLRMHSVRFIILCSCKNTYRDGFLKKQEIVKYN